MAQFQRFLQIIQSLHALSFDRGVNGVEDNPIIGILKELIDLIEDGKADMDIEIKERKGEEKWQ